MAIYHSGLTLTRAIVHAEKIFSAGQLGVAISRVRDPADLQLVGFSKHACTGHKGSVTSFYGRTSPTVHDDLSCCHHSVEGF